MNNLFQENRKNLLILLGLLFILVIVFYFLFFQPLSKELKAKESETKQVESDIALLQVQFDNAEAPDLEENKFETLRLAKKMPLDPELRSLILTLEEIEMVSGSRFESISFSYDGSVPERYIEEEESEGTEENAVEEKTGDLLENEETTEDGSDIINMEEKPENLHVITLNMDITTPDYEHFQTFIKEIEKQERMMMVSSMDFQKPGESELLLVEEPDKSITINVDITTFYYEE